MTYIIQYVKYGLAHLENNQIYLNQHLKEYPKLHEFCIRHEIEHMKGNNLDFSEKLSEEFIYKDMVIFIFKHPSTWIHFLPITINKENNKYIIHYSNTYLRLWGAIAIIIFMWIMYFVLVYGK